MKQEISDKQWSQLTKDQADKIQGWMMNNNYQGDGGDSIDWFNLTVGMMIQFIKPGLDTIKTVLNGPTFGASIPKWQILFDMDKFMGKGINVNTLYNFIEVELCDALWEAVKTILNNEQKQK